MFVGQGINDPNPIWQLEFWNHSIEKFWGIDGSAPGPALDAEPRATDGTQAPADLGPSTGSSSNGVADRGTDR